jgi:hypothetical protein
MPSDQASTLSAWHDPAALAQPLRQRLTLLLTPLRRSRDAHSDARRVPTLGRACPPSWSGAIAPVVGACRRGGHSARSSAGPGRHQAAVEAGAV